MVATSHRHITNGVGPRGAVFVPSTVRWTIDTAIVKCERLQDLDSNRRPRAGPRESNRQVLNLNSVLVVRMLKRQKEIKMRSPATMTMLTRNLVLKLVVSKMCSVSKRDTVPRRCPDGAQTVPRAVPATVPSGKT